VRNKWISTLRKLCFYIISWASIFRGREREREREREVKERKGLRSVHIMICKVYMFDILKVMDRMCHQSVDTDRNCAVGVGSE